MISRRKGVAARSHSGAPFLRQITGDPDRVPGAAYPFNVPAFSQGISLTLDWKVTFFVGENGSGKSTLLEAVADCCGFNPEGGNRDHHRATFAERSSLAQALRLSWRPKTTEGFFMRAETFFNFATYIEGVSTMSAYGGTSLHAQSHGESFLALFTNRFEQGLYILDEPEAALSPQRQLSFLKIIHDLAAPGHVQCGDLHEHGPRQRHAVPLHGHGGERRGRRPGVRIDQRHAQRALGGHHLEPDRE